MIPELKDLLQSGITSEDVAKIIALSKSFTTPNEQIDIIPNGTSLDSKDSVKAVLKKAFSNDMTKFAKSIIAQKAMTASGATPQTVAKVALLTKSMAENGMTANDIANALTMAMSLSDPDNKGNCCRVLGPNLKKSRYKNLSNQINQKNFFVKLHFRQF